MEHRALTFASPDTLIRQMFAVVADVTAVCVPLIGSALTATQFPASSAPSNCTVPENEPCKLMVAEPNPVLGSANHKATEQAATASVVPAAEIVPAVESIIATPS